MQTDQPTRHDAGNEHPRQSSGDDRTDAVLECELNAYIDGELPPATRRIFEQRLVADTAARARAAELIRIKTLVQLAYGVTMTA